MPDPPHTATAETCVVVCGPAVLSEVKFEQSNGERLVEQRSDRLTYIFTWSTVTSPHDNTRVTSLTTGLCYTGVLPLDILNNMTFTHTCSQYVNRLVTPNIVNITEGDMYIMWANDDTSRTLWYFIF